jgi:hypothetical protein
MVTNNDSWCNVMLHTVNCFSWQAEEIFLLAGHGCLPWQYHLIKKQNCTKSSNTHCTTLKFTEVFKLKRIVSDDSDHIQKFGHDIARVYKLWLLYILETSAAWMLQYINILQQVHGRKQETDRKLH